MTDREAIREPPFECPECGSEYARLGQHWAMGDCDPVVSGDQHAVLQGLLLAGAHATDGAVIGQTSSQQLAEWTTRELGWLAGRLTRVRFDEPEKSPIYRLRTPSHWAVETYEDWTDSPPSEYELSPRAGRVWWAYAGGLQWHGDYNSQRTAAISALDDGRADWILRVLADVGVDATRAGKRVQWHGEQLREWLAWIGDPVPGAEYKWASSPVTYQAARHKHESRLEYRVTLAVTALEVAADKTTDTLTREGFAEEIDVVSADMVADVLGGGSFEDACSVAGVTDNGSGVALGSIDGDVVQWSQEDCVEAIQSAVGELGEPLSNAAYREWARGRSDVPSVETVAGTNGRFERWRDACEAAGVQTVRIASSTSREELVGAVREYFDADELASLTVTAYQEAARGNPSLPSIAPIYDRFEGWHEFRDAVVDDASQGSAE